MKLDFSYNYAKLSGLVKVSLYFDRPEEKVTDFYLKINGEICKLNFDNDYLSKNNKIDFGINTYHFSNRRSEFLMSIELFQSDIPINKLELMCSNDELINDYIYEKIVDLPSLIGLPIDSAIFSKFNRKVFPSPYVCGDTYNDFRANGFLHLKNFYDDQFMDSVAAELDYYCDKNYLGYEEGSSMRIQQLHSLGGKFTELFKDYKIREELKNIYGVDMLPCQSLAYKYGSQQSVHSDFIHLTPYPINLMCGVWVALEDVVADSGELVVYPGSHNEKSLLRSDFGLDYVRNNDYSAYSGDLSNNWKSSASKYDKHKALLKKGDILIWDANLLHEGSQRRLMEITRKSVVFHFFGKGAICYYDSTGDIGFAGEIAVMN
jgi:hypothetical protein